MDFFPALLHFIQITRYTMCLWAILRALYHRKIELLGAKLVYKLRRNFNMRQQLNSHDWICIVFATNNYISIEYHMLCLVRFWYVVYIDSLSASTSAYYDSWRSMLVASTWLIHKIKISHHYHLLSFHLNNCSSVL